MVGILPLLAVAIIDEQLLGRSLTMGKNFATLLRHQGFNSVDELREHGRLRGEPGKERLLLSVAGVERLQKMFEKLFDEDEFLSPYGLRALSAYHREHPYELRLDGFSAAIDYEPAESTTSMFGGNSNWRGPLWFPLNYLLVSALERYHRFFGDELTVEYPTGSGNQLTLDAIGQDLEGRLISIFLVGPDGRRPASAGSSGSRAIPRGRTTWCSTSTSTATTVLGWGRPTRPPAPADPYVSVSPSYRSCRPGHLMAGLAQAQCAKYRGWSATGFLMDFFMIHGSR